MWINLSYVIFGLKCCMLVLALQIWKDTKVPPQICKKVRYLLYNTTLIIKKHPRDSSTYHLCSSMYFSLRSVQKTHMYSNRIFWIVPNYVTWSGIHKEIILRIFSFLLLLRFLVSSSSCFNGDYYYSHLLLGKFLVASCRDTF